MCENIFAFLQLQFQMYVQSEKFLQLGEKSSRDPIWRTDDEDDSRIFFAIFFMIAFLSSQILSLPSRRRLCSHHERERVETRVCHI